MEIIGKISKGSKMDQIYLPKNRAGFSIGDYVIIKPLKEKDEIKRFEKLYFYNVKDLEPTKLKIIYKILEILDKSIDYENIFITGSFLDEGFHFNDIDTLIISENKINHDLIKILIEKKIGIKAHILSLKNKELIKGLETDPLYQMMLSKCVSKKRFIYKTKYKKNYKILDLHLLKSKALIDSFDVLSGDEKYNLVRNMITIYLYLKSKKVNRYLIDNKIKEIFNLKNINELKQNILDKKSFLKKYKLVYNKTFARILKGIKNGAKQK